jgi:lipid-binding SYLF domain-containing protein
MATGPVPQEVNFQGLEGKAGARSAGNAIGCVGMSFLLAGCRGHPHDFELLQGTSTICAVSGSEMERIKNMKKTIAMACMCFMMAAPAFAASSRADLQERIDSAKIVLDQIMAAGDKSIPMNILQSATCVGVVPGMIKGAFVFGGQYGQGVVTCRTGHGWSAPVFIRMAGGSFGFQIGGQATDLVLVAVNDRGFQDLLKNKFKIGGDASAAAGPVGRSTQAATDWKMNAELLSYSRNKGVFAGISLDGTSVSQNSDDTEIYYGAAHSFQTILKGSIEVPAGAVPFVRTVAHYFVEAKNR